MVLELAQANFLSSILDIASTQGANGWVGLGINLIVATIVSGIVLIILLKVAGHEWGEAYHIGNAFIIALIINAINLFGIINYLSPMIPLGSLILPVIIWVLLMKVFFSTLSLKHVVIIGVVGWILSIFLVPYITPMVMGFIPAV